MPLETLTLVHRGLAGLFIGLLAFFAPRNSSLVDGFVVSRRATTRFNQDSSTSARTRIPTALSGHVINTNFEWLAEGRLADDDAYSGLSWIDLTGDDSQREKADAKMESTNKEMTIPLYPLGATYLPAPGVNYTLNNVEPRNIAMALDLMNGTDERLFCVVLRGSDTGRIASVGTVMRLLEIEEHRGWSDPEKIHRIVVTCCAVGLVDILHIENEHAATWLSRLSKSPEYLRARVRMRLDDEPMHAVDEATQMQDIIRDYNAVRVMYSTSTVGSQELPEFARAKMMSSMTEWTVDDFLSSASFWRAALTWQSLCHTVREQRQILLSSNQNEIMVAAACELKGPLKLPIHAEDLPPDVQRQLQLMEVEEQTKFLETRLDPCLDFQAMLTMTTLCERVEFLARMVARERQRLEDLLLSQQTNDSDNNQSLETKATVDYKPKGAWFDDGVW